MNKILIVEDNQLFSKLMRKRLTEELQLECVVKKSYQEAVKILEKDSEQFMLAVLDLNLPDAPDGEIVDYVISRMIPAVVVTARIDEKTRSKIIAKQVLDYIIKGPYALDLLATTVRRYIRNQDVTILLVDDSRTSRMGTRKILETQHFIVIDASDGEDALDKLKQYPSIKLVLTDYNMPKMDGFELTTKIRSEYPLDQMAIIGMSAQGDPLLSSQFLKRGANDFIIKPFFVEELIWRVNQNVEMLDHLKRLRDAAIKDPMTKLYNRRYFFDAGAKRFTKARRRDLDIALVMLDIDHFKSVNDNFGHANGDLVLIEVAKLLQDHFSDKGIVARYGGEEFIILADQIDILEIEEQLEKLRHSVEAFSLDTKEGKIDPTISIGATTSMVGNLEETIKQADELLYQAKENGRNRVVIR